MNAESISSNSTFKKGVSYELANRAFSLRVAERLSQRLEGDIEQVLWLDYLKLEKFSLPRYRTAAQKMGLDSQVGCWTGFKAWVVGSVPTFFLDAALKSAHEKTTAYLDKLRELQQISPQEYQDFSDYMVAQEVLQVNMMALALAGDYESVTREVNAFITQYSVAQ